MPVYNRNLGRFFGPSSSYSGYVFIGCGIFFSFYSLLALTLLIPGIFMAFTYNGTILDTDKKRVKSYTALFGIIKTGKWISINEFTKFSIVKATKRYTTYSRANVRFDRTFSDIELLLVSGHHKKIVINKFNNFEDAHKEMEELSRKLFS
jgi:hypothetical protein